MDAIAAVEDAGTVRSGFMSGQPVPVPWKSKTCCVLDLTWELGRGEWVRC